MIFLFCSLCYNKINKTKTTCQAMTNASFGMDILSSISAKMFLFFFCVCMFFLLSCPLTVSVFFRHHTETHNLCAVTQCSNNRVWHSNNTKTGCMALWLQSPWMFTRHEKYFFLLQKLFLFLYYHCYSKAKLTNVFYIYMQIALYTASCTCDSLINFLWALCT